jgi:serine/threonine-protein kinase
MARSTGVIAAALPEYDIERELGRGAMGVVYLGRHRRLDRPVAIKELPEAFGANPEMRHRFGVEARVLATLNHPHVVPVFDYVESAGVCLLVMEALPGGTVWERFTTSGLSMPQACAVILATCSALEHAHGQGILHRDVKPENLMFGAADTVKVTDFGIAKVLGGSKTMATADGSVLGTPAYMAPEQAEGSELTAQVDVYATGTMLYEMLSGRLPFARGESMMAMLVARITHDPPPLRDLAPMVPAALADVVMSAIARDPAQRLRSAEEFGCVLGSAAATAWGPEWLSLSGMPVQGSETISRAARTTLTEPVGGSVPGSAGPRVEASPSIGAGGGDAVGRPPVSGHGGDDRDTVMGSPPATSPSSSAESGGEGSAPATVVRPEVSHHEVVFDAEAVARGDIVDIAEVTRPPSAPVASTILGLVLFLLGVVVAVVGIGTPPLDQVVDDGAVQLAEVDVATDERIDLDLDQTLRVTGLAGDRVALSLRLLEIPLGTTEAAPIGADGTAEIDPGAMARVASGAVTGTLEVFDRAGNEVIAHDVAIDAVNPWYTSAMGIVGVLVSLFAVAAVESNLRMMRRGRLRMGALVSLGVSGAVLGAGVALLATAVLATPRTVPGVVVPAALCAAGAVVFGLAAARNGRRRRVKRRLEARSTRR